MAIYTATDPFSLMLLLLQERIKAEVAGVDQVVKDVGQLETQERPAIMPNTVLVSFQNWTFSNEGQHMQMGDGDVIIKVTTPFYDIVDADKPVDVNETALKFLALSQEVYETLHGWTLENATVKDLFGPLTRTGWSEDTRRPGLGVMVHRYRLNLEDRSKKTTRSKTSVVPSINVEFKKP